MLKCILHPFQLLLCGAEPRIVKPSDIVVSDMRKAITQPIVEFLVELSRLEAGPHQVCQIIQELSLGRLAFPLSGFELFGGEDMFAHDVCSCSMLDSGAG